MTTAVSRDDTLQNNSAAMGKAGVRDTDNGGVIDVGRGCTFPKYLSSFHL